jgi:hypothetical protein
MKKKELEIATTTYTVAYKKGYTQCQKDMFEEAELKDWDVTLNDGLENEPYVSDDFQIGPDGAYEHTQGLSILPREKASELVDKFSNKCLLTTDGGKVAALIAVDEIKRILYDQDSMIRYDYWFEVKQEIEKL